MLAPCSSFLCIYDAAFKTRSYLLLWSAVSEVPATCALCLWVDDLCTVQALVSRYCALCQPQAAQLELLMLNVSCELLQRSQFSVLSTCEQNDFLQAWKQWSCFYLWSKELRGAVHTTHRAAWGFTVSCMSARPTGLLLRELHPGHAIGPP